MRDGTGGPARLRVHTVEPGVATAAFAPAHAFHPPTSPPAASDRSLPVAYARRAPSGNRPGHRTQEIPISRTRTTNATARLVAASVTLGAVLATAAMLVALLFAAETGHLPPGSRAPAERGPRVTVVSASDLVSGIANDGGQLFDVR